MKGDRLDRVAAFVEALRKGRRPPRFPAEPDESNALRAAAALSGAIPGSDAPRPEFVERLHRRLSDAGQPDGTRATVTRRGLFHKLSVPAIAALIGVAAGASIRTVVDRLSLGQEPANGQLVPDGVGHWAPVVPLASLPPGRPVYFTASAIQGFLVKQPGEVVALSAICTHLGCLLKAPDRADQLDCPCHGASFTLAGTPLHPEYTTPLPRLSTRLKDGMVEVFVV